MQLFGFCVFNLQALVHLIRPPRFGHKNLLGKEPIGIFAFIVPLAWSKWLRMLTQATVSSSQKINHGALLLWWFGSQPIKHGAWTSRVYKKNYSYNMYIYICEILQHNAWNLFISHQRVKGETLHLACTWWSTCQAWHGKGTSDWVSNQVILPKPDSPEN